MAKKIEITAAMRSPIGVESKPWAHEVATTRVRAIARGVGYTDRADYDVAAAQAAGYRSLSCPPTFPGTAVFIAGESSDT